LAKNRIERGRKMNFHYIDYMIKERTKIELEACERQRLLNSAGYSQTALIRRGFRNLVNTVRRVTKRWSASHRRLYPNGFMVRVVARIRRDSR